MNTKKNLEGKFNPKDFEETLYQRWEERGYFKPTMDKNKKPYCRQIHEQKAAFKGRKAWS